jgi:hypothetical protein
MVRNFFLVCSPLCSLHSRVRQVKKEFYVGDVKVEYVDAPMEAPAGMEGLFGKFMSVSELLAPRAQTADGVDDDDVVVVADATAGEEERAEAQAAALKKKWEKEQKAKEELQLTKQQRKEEKRLRTAMLKQLVDKPEVVDM